MSSAPRSVVRCPTSRSVCRLCASVLMMTYSRLMPSFSSPRVSTSSPARTPSPPTGSANSELAVTDSTPSLTIAVGLSNPSSSARPSLLLIPRSTSSVCSTSFRGRISPFPTVGSAVGCETTNPVGSTVSDTSANRLSLKCVGQRTPRPSPRSPTRIALAGLNQSAVPMFEDALLSLLALPL